MFPYLSSNPHKKTQEAFGGSTSLDLVHIILDLHGQCFKGTIRTYKEYPGILCFLSLQKRKRYREGTNLPKGYGIPRSADMLTAKSSCTKTITIPHNIMIYTHKGSQRSLAATAKFKRERERERDLLHGTCADVSTILTKESIM
jgi:hypothetical protein